MGDAGRGGDGDGDGDDAGSGEAGAQTRVSFPNSAGVEIVGRLFLPAGSGPFPAVIALHGCGGSNNSRGELVRRERDWADRWVAAGHAVLLPDSFFSRGLGAQCTVADREVRQSVERVQDVLAARAFLQARRDIRPEAITLVGWSNGAGTALYAISARNRPTDGSPDFRRAIAFYPGCRNVLARGITPRLPLTILIGDADNWTPPAPAATMSPWRARPARAPRSSPIPAPITASTPRIWPSGSVAVLPSRPMGRGAP